MTPFKTQTRIHKLDPYTSNKIAAGEVVERPAAVVKELVENAIDSGANQITVEIRKAGKQYIRVTDNGSGIHPEDIGLAFERHATSKIKAIQDLFAIESLGFRGEALASIASVSMTELITKTADQEMGIRVELAGGKQNHTEATGCPKGTTVIVKELFFNTPARQKFMKANATETGHITDLVNKLAISHPTIRFKYLVDQKELFTTPGKGDLLNTLLNIYDKKMVQQLIPVQEDGNTVNIKGFISNFEYTRGNRQMQMFFVNGRYIKSKVLAEALALAYKSRLPVNRFPACFLMLEIDFGAIDVNIHPAKTEIRFDEEHLIKQHVYQILKKHLLQYNQVPQVALSSTERQKDLPVQLPREPVAATQPSRIKPIERPSRGDRVYEKPAPYSKPVIQTPPSRPIELASHKTETKPLEQDLIQKKVDPFLDQYFKKPQAAPEKEEQVILKIQTERRLNEKETAYDDLRMIGQLFNTYLLAEKEQQLYLIDQHAAHEKILYEQFRAEYKASRIIKQILLEPIIIDLDHAQVPVVSSHFDDFQRLGIQMEMFGDRSVIIREVPMLFDRPASKAFAEQLLDSLVDDPLGKDLFEYKQERIILESCKSAIKANDAIAMPEITELIKGLKQLDDPYTCPHGRPIMIQISKHEIERKFKRT